MDVALKQRLVGASVLVALGVILIPMLLEGPRDARNATSIPIPEQPQQGFETRLLPVNPREADSEEPAPTPAAERPGEIVSVDTGQAQAPAIPPTAMGVAPADPPGADSGGRWILQLGSFGNAANAARLVASLEEAGWNAYQEKVTVAADTLYRVRVGAWSSKDEAAAEGVAIGARFKDLEVSVRALGEAEVPSAGSLNGWMVQVGSFSKEGNAYQLRDRLRAGGLSAQVDAFAAATGGGFKVRVGPELDRAAAQRLRERLREQYDLNGIIVEHP